jgi:hypothetical protein
MTLKKQQISFGSKCTAKYFSNKRFTIARISKLLSKTMFEVVRARKGKKKLERTTKKQNQKK